MCSRFRCYLIPSKVKVLGVLLVLAVPYKSQTIAKQQLLDSINQAQEHNRGVFNLYIKPLKVEVIAGVFRNREYPTQGFEPVNLTYHVYFPFQFDLSYVHLKARDKLLKINTLAVFHHSKYGNYALGLANRFSFLIHKKTYFCYQIGLVWCEAIKRNTNDGITTMGFCLHHEFTLSYQVCKQLDLSINVLHLSNAAIFKNVKNNQDVVGLGMAYQF